MSPPSGPSLARSRSIEGGRGLRLSRLVMGYLPVLYRASRTARSTSRSSTRARARRPARASSCAATATTCRSSRPCCATGSAVRRAHGEPSPYPVLMFLPLVSTSIHRGWARSRPCSTPAAGHGGRGGRAGRQAQLTFRWRVTRGDLAMVTARGRPPPRPDRIRPGGLLLAESEPGSGGVVLKDGAVPSGRWPPARHVRALRDGAGATPATRPARLARRGSRADDWRTSAWDSESEQPRFKLGDDDTTSNSSFSAPGAHRASPVSRVGSQDHFGSCGRIPRVTRRRNICALHVGLGRVPCPCPTLRASRPTAQ